MLRSCATPTARTLVARTSPPSVLRAAHLSSSAPHTAPRPSSPAAASTTTASTSAASTSAPTPAASHFLVTLLRSPLHLAASQKASAASLGLYKRLSSSIVPITAQNAGYVVQLKELVGVRACSEADVARWGAREWREREGEGRQGSGMRVKLGGDKARSVIRVGSERARGDERGFRVVRP
ncbi:hypothetical protein JCM3775_006989 [Rhodotorula graminis]|uniref:Ribosomal protein L30 ferredoxin-like fold domain-containing protein n=1 Tax=Rhodotorula graminis (strain WP1) TaxID=578459 RepID=A0A0P9EV17_RHOGW|nr:uncharacterized protein RHOBADRAFT_46063 [Rhodotorula graminis WP1]KPV72969.1 hypothetical protein RHOBADRAFT_46063 [Rhodotorula graminis WP1]